MDTSGLQSKYAALRDYLISADLYGTGATENFDREELSRRFTEYYDAEAALRQELVDDTRGTVSELEGDKDNIAKGLGYADYQEMKKAKDAGKTIIDGDYIRTSVIKTNDLYAENLSTNVDREGERVEIIGSMRSLKVFDSDNKECTVVTGRRTSNYLPDDMTTEYADMSPYSFILNMGVSVAKPKTSDTVSKYDQKTISKFTISDTSDVNIPPISWELSASARSPAGISTYAIATIHGQLIRRLPDGMALAIKDLFQVRVVDNHTSGLSPAYTETNILAGKYEIIIFAGIYLGYVSDLSSSVMWEGSGLCKASASRDVSIVKQSTPSTTIYSNGISSFWGAGKYFSVINQSNKDFVRAVDGDNGFALNADNGFLVSTNAGTKVPNWNMPMNCVLMGIVKGTGIPGPYRSCSPNLRAAASPGDRPGRYAISFKTASGSESTYFSTPNDYVVVVYPKSDVASGYGLFEATPKSASAFQCSTVRWDHVAKDMEFVFFVIDIRNWTI